MIVVKFCCSRHSSSSSSSSNSNSCPIRRYRKIPDSSSPSPPKMPARSPARSSGSATLSEQSRSRSVKIPISVSSRESGGRKLKVSLRHKNSLSPSSVRSFVSGDSEASSSTYCATPAVGPGGKGKNAAGKKTPKRRFQNPKIEPKQLYLGKLPTYRQNFERCSLEVPVFLVDAFALISFKYMNLEGLFRKEGNAQRVKMIWGPFLGQVGIPECCNGHDICSLVKKFFRLLDEPIFTWSLQGQFVQFATIKNEEIRLKCVLELCHVLPTVHRDALAYTMRYLKKITEHSAENKMDSVALGTVLAPCLFRDTKTTLEKIQKATAAPVDKEFMGHMREDVGTKAQLVDLLIRHAEEIAILTEYEKVMSPRMYEALLPEDDPESPLAQRLYPGRRPRPQRNRSLDARIPPTASGVSTSNSMNNAKGRKAYSVMKVKGHRQKDCLLEVEGESQESFDRITPSRRKSGRLASTTDHSGQEKQDDWNPQPPGLLDFDYESPRPDPLGGETSHIRCVAKMDIDESALRLKARDLADDVGEIIVTSSSPAKTVQRMYPNLTPHMEEEQMLELPILEGALEEHSPKRKSGALKEKCNGTPEIAQFLYPDLSQVEAAAAVSTVQKSPDRKRERRSMTEVDFSAKAGVYVEEMFGEVQTVLKASTRTKMSKQRRNTAPVKKYALRRGKPNTLTTGLHMPADRLEEEEETSGTDDSWLSSPLKGRRFSHSDSDLRNLRNLNVHDSSSGDESLDRVIPRTSIRSKVTVSMLQAVGELEANLKVGEHLDLFVENVGVMDGVEMGAGTRRLMEARGREAKERRRAYSERRSPLKGSQLTEILDSKTESALEISASLTENSTQVLTEQNDIVKSAPHQEDGSPHRSLRKKSASKSPEKVVKGPEKLVESPEKFVEHPMRVEDEDFGMKSSQKETKSQDEDEVLEDVFKMPQAVVPPRRGTPIKAESVRENGSVDGGSSECVTRRKHCGGTIQKMPSLEEDEEGDFGFEHSDDRMKSILCQNHPEEMKEASLVLGVRPSIAYIRQNKAGNVSEKAKLFSKTE